jgi:hypothetical protein
MKDQKLQELSESIAKLKESIGASISAMPDSQNKELYDSMYRMCDGIYSYIDRVASNLYNHTDPASHIPPIKGAGQMNKALKALGMSEDYEVKPKVIYSSRNNIIITAKIPEN